MLPRVLEPEVMDSPEEAASYDAMDHEAVNHRFVDDFLAAYRPMRGGKILDVGTGTARIPIVLGTQEPEARILGVDLARHMLDLGRRNVREAGLSDRVALELVDAKGLPFPDESFDGVISNSIVHHIPDPGSAMAEMVRVLAPGGTLFVRDLARPPTREVLDALVAAYAGSEPADARDMFAASLHAALTTVEVRGLVRALGLDAEGVATTSDRHWTWTWHKPD